MARILVSFLLVALMALAAHHHGHTSALAAQGATTGYKVDPVHSAVVFKIGHLGVGNVWGRFNQFSGSVSFDPDQPASTTFDLTIQAKSVDTGNDRRDNHLRGPDFFNATQFPAITFKSTRTEVAADGTLSVTGDLTLHGVTKPMTLPVAITGHKDLGEQMGTRAGFEATFTLKRSEFGVNYGIEQGMVGDDVLITVSLEAVKQ